MDCCSSPQALEYAPEIDQTADQLAVLLARTPEYQEFVRLAQLIHLDPNVKRISMEIRKSQMFYAVTEGKISPDLEAELDTLPAIQAYRKAERAVKELFHAVDWMISDSAGMEFASNAIHSGCG
jgi:cell fate (sporulation/competence/biofilm development) regulator YlbF (YheA/YmcA/DUF963 family)